MAVLAHKAPLPSASSMGSSSASVRDYTPATATHRMPVSTAAHNSFTSPTESEFSEAFDGPDSVKSWDEKRVSEWLKSINCGQYADAFKANHVNGSNLIECDQAVLKEMGIKKVGDRVRISIGIKNLRQKSVPNQKKRNRDSMAMLDSRAILTPSSNSTGSPRSANHTRDRSYNAPSNRRFSRHIDTASLDLRPSSPLADPEARTRNALRAAPSPMENARREQAGGYFNSPASAKTVSGKRPEGVTRSGQRNPINDHTISKLPVNMPVVRVIHGGGETKVVDIKGCRTGEQITQATLKKLGLPETHVHSYCFYTSDEYCTEPEYYRRLSEYELQRLCTDLSRPERGRLILRKIHHGEPTYEEIEKARSINAAEVQEAHKAAMAANNPRNLNKATKTLGEPMSTLQYPLSPAKFESPARSKTDRAKTPNVQISDPNPPPRRTDSRARPLKQFLGNRPESELISQELTTYFPDHNRQEIERTVTMSQRRSARLSRALSRLSVASNSSFASSLKDAPPLPTISDAWLSGAANAAGTRGPRPLSVSRFPGGSNYRDSIISTSLQPLQEESTERKRKSYVSDSSSDVTPSDRASTYYDPDAGTSTIGSATEVGSMGEQYRAAIAEDGEGPDPELDQFLSGNSWDNLKWMKGSLIGQGSFGSVYLALHAVTGELMAVKQVEMPSKNNSEIDKKKEGMIAALQREINLLERLQHPNIVKYLGSNYHDEHFNIFLEYVPGGSVAAMLNSYGQLQEPLIRNFVRQILEGLAYLHDQDIIHRDIKGANVLVDNKGQVKISDFGISKRVEVSAFSNPVKGGHLNRTSLQGSVFWMAPEVVKQTSYTLKADIWSLGCLVVEMFTGEHPFPNCNQMQAIFQIGSGSAKPTTPDVASEEGKEFLDQTFIVDFEKRPSAKELMNSTFLKQIA